VVQGTATIHVIWIRENKLIFYREMIKLAVDTAKRIISAFRNEKLLTLSVTLHGLLAVM
jgi:hypothetical protein